MIQMSNGIKSQTISQELAVGHSEDRDAEQGPSEGEPLAPREEAAVAGTDNPELRALTHEEAIDLMGLYLAHDMTASQRAMFVAHIRGCPSCHEKLLALEIYLRVAARRPPKTQS
jgi:hypothetical protein